MTRCRGTSFIIWCVALLFLFSGARWGVAQSIGDAVDATQFVWVVGGAATWSNQTAVTHDGVDAAQSGAILDNEVSWFQTSVTGPVTVTFWWRVDSEVGADSLKFIVDSVTRDEIWGQTDWAQVSYSIVAGPHTLRWSYDKDTDTSIGLDSAWVDQIEIAAPQSLPLGDVLESTQLVWNTGGATNWIGETLITHDGVDAAQSGTITNNQDSWMETSVTGPVSVTFWWRVDSEEDFDFLTFSIDGFALNAISGLVDWQYQGFTIGGGVHTMRWVYAKDVAGAAGADGGWVDELSFSPIPPPATRYVATNSPFPSLPYTNWQTAARSIQQAVDAAQPGDLVLVSNGTYRSGIRALGGQTQLNRVLISKPVTVRSVNGPRFTTIVGARDPLLSNGVKSARCVYVTNGASLSGFTLTNGYSSIGGGGVFCAPAGIVSNCVIVGNNAIGSVGGGGLGGFYFNTVFWGNRAIWGGGVASGMLQNCSVASNSAVTAGGAYQSFGTNAIVYFNQAATNANVLGGGFAHTCSTPALPGDENIASDPLFAGLATGNLRLASGSPCLGAGTNLFWMAFSVDLDGNPRIAGARVDLGAFERLIEGYDSWAMAITNGLTNYNDSATGDGFYNLLKYATGSSPTNADLVPLLSGGMTNSGLRLRFNRNTNATDVTIYVDMASSCSDLATWVSIATNRGGGWGASSNVTESGVGSPVVVQVLEAGPLGTNRFMRLRVSRP